MSSASGHPQPLPGQLQSGLHYQHQPSLQSVDMAPPEVQESQLQLTFTVPHMTDSLDPSSWFTKIQNELTLHAVPEDSKIRAFVSGLEGK